MGKRFTVTVLLVIAAAMFAGSINQPTGLVISNLEKSETHGNLELPNEEHVAIEIHHERIEEPEESAESKAIISPALVEEAEQQEQTKETPQETPKPTKKFTIKEEVPKEITKPTFSDTTTKTGGMFGWVTNIFGGLFGTNIPAPQITNAYVDEVNKKLVVTGTDFYPSSSSPGSIYMYFLMKSVGGEYLSYPFNYRDSTEVSIPLNNLNAFNVVIWFVNVQDRGTGNYVQGNIYPFNYDGSGGDGLIAHYQFENNAQDSTGNYDGTTSGDAIFSSDSKRGSSSLEVNGNGYVNLPSNIDLSTNTSTIAFWFKADSVNDCGGRFISKAGGVQEQNHWWMMSTCNSQLRSRLKTTGTTSTLKGGSISTGVWTHGAMVYDGTEMKLYVDGVEVSKVSKSGTIDVDNSINTWAGANPDSSNYYDGKIDDLRIYNTALSDNDIAGLAGACNYDGICSGDETACTCSDCSSVCGDGCVSGGEVCDGDSQSCTTSNGYSGSQSCSSDCTGYNNCVSNDYCGDGVCQTYNEDSNSCSQDCFCGDGICDSTEDVNSCPNDCTTGCPNGKPGPSNTGPITPKSQLANYNGPMTITQEGTVIEGVYINSGTLSIKADNVVIRDVVIDCGDGKQTGWPYYCLQATFGAKNLIVEDVEIFGGSSAIVFANDITLRRAELHTDGSDAMKIRSNSLVEENWIHHPLGIGSKAPHADAEQMRAGSNTIFRCNNMDIPINYGGGTKSNACFIIQEEVGDIKNVLIDNNWCNGGNFGVFLRSNAKYGYGCLENVIVSNNKFGRDYRYGLMSQNCDDGGKPGYTCGNIWEDTGDTITKANGGWDQDDDVCS